MAVSEDHHSFEASSQLPMSIECLEWFAARKISPQTLVRNHITERQVCMSSKQPDTELAIVYPSIYKGQSIGTKYRTLDRRWSQSKQFQTVWYGMDDVDGHNTVIIVEGKFLYTLATIPYFLLQLVLATFPLLSVVHISLIALQLNSPATSILWKQRGVSACNDTLHVHISMPEVNKALRQARSTNLLCTTDSCACAL